MPPEPRPRTDAGSTSPPRSRRRDFTPWSPRPLRPVQPAPPVPQQRLAKPKLNVRTSGRGARRTLRIRVTNRPPRMTMTVRVSRCARQRQAPTDRDQDRPFLEADAASLSSLDAGHRVLQGSDRDAAAKPVGEGLTPSDEDHARPRDGHAGAGLRVCGGCAALHGDRLRARRRAVRHPPTRAGHHDGQLPSPLGQSFGGYLVASRAGTSNAASGNWAAWSLSAPPSMLIERLALERYLGTTSAGWEAKIVTAENRELSAVSGRGGPRGASSAPRVAPGGSTRSCFLPSGRHPCPSLSRCIAGSACANETSTHTAWVAVYRATRDDR